MDEHFIIDDLPVMYGRPSTHQNLESFEQRFEAAMLTARSRANSNSHGLILLLESGACFYQKRNMFYRAFELMLEVARSMSRRTPRHRMLLSLDLLARRCLARIRRRREISATCFDEINKVFGSEGDCPFCAELEDLSPAGIAEEVRRIHPVSTMAKSFA